MKTKDDNRITISLDGLIEGIRLEGNSKNKFSKKAREILSDSIITAWMLGATAKNGFNIEEIIKNFPNHKYLNRTTLRIVANMLAEQKLIKEVI